METLVATGSWEVVYTHPLHLRRGDKIALNPAKKEENPEWAGWIWAEVPGNAGWVPEQSVLRLSDHEAVMTDDYSARELTVRPGDVVQAVRHLNGWVWARKEGTGETGWAPRHIFTQAP